MTPERFRDLAIELAEENPLAIRPFLRLVGIKFTTEVPTLEVTCDERPLLQVNVDFVAEHCATDEHVKAVILHEFLHVLLRHTEQQTPVTAEDHLATDAVINAIIHRQAGPSWSSMMGRYYARESGLRRLLRPPRQGEAFRGTSEFESIWEGLYAGMLVVDDIREIAARLSGSGSSSGRNKKRGDGAAPGTLLLGGHATRNVGESEALKEALRQALRAMSGCGIWRSPFSRGVGGGLVPSEIPTAHVAIEKWKRRTLATLRRFVIPDARSAMREPVPSPFVLPVLSPGDRRAFVRSLWSPLFPEAIWSGSVPQPVPRTQIYLDVSGSMNVEMPHLIALLHALRRHIRMPFWAFSDQVAPATIRKGRLVTATTGGTSLACVLAHIAKTRPASAVIVTDGYIERLSHSDVAVTAPARLHAIVTRDGSTQLLAAAGIGCTQLERFPA